MASLVQAEGGRTEDYPKIARVIYNRLAQGMPLQLDSTVLYGLNAYGIIASNAQLNSTSPYNTYKYKGLTPGPIDSPGNAAIDAVLHPAAGNWSGTLVNALIAHCGASLSGIGGVKRRCRAGSRHIHHRVGAGSRQRHRRHRCFGYERAGGRTIYLQHHRRSHAQRSAAGI